MVQHADVTGFGCPVHKEVPLTKVLLLLVHFKVLMIKYLKFKVVKI